MIGISSNTKWAEDHCWKKDDTYCYVYWGENGYKHDKSGMTAYSEAFSSNDIITVLVDFDKHTIAFAKNGVDLGIAYSNVKPQQTYRLTVCFIDTAKLEMISYKNVSARAEEFAAFLSELGLTQYLSAFTEEGFETVDDLQDIDHAQLKEVGISKMAHRNKILKGIRAFFTSKAYNTEATTHNYKEEHK
eukprot:1069269_1